MKAKEEENKNSNHTLEDGIMVCVDREQRPVRTITPWLNHLFFELTFLHLYDAEFT